MTIYCLGLIGYPLGHSLSPKIHTAALKACGLEGDYSLFPVHPDDRRGLKDLLNRVRSKELHGLNVTIPHKQNVIDLMDELTPTAKDIGAVNTIYLKNEKLIGDNTDAPGFLSDLNNFWAEFPSPSGTIAPEAKRSGGGAGVREKSATVLGAGGSARAIVYSLLKDGWKVTIAARRSEQARGLADSFSNYQLPITLLTDLQPSTFDLIVNATPLGMFPNIDTSPLPENATLSKHTKIYDLVYNPRETKLVKDARSQGLQAITGLGMLIEQAALAFEMWTGHNPPRDILYTSVVER